jgi:hypothetical protein
MENDHIRKENPRTFAVAKRYFESRVGGDLNVAEDFDRDCVLLKLSPDRIVAIDETFLSDFGADAIEGALDGWNVLGILQTLHEGSRLYIDSGDAEVIAHP